MFGRIILKAIFEKWGAKVKIKKNPVQGPVTASVV
jgi:hypothetical protein